MPPKSWFRQLLGRDVDKTDFITRTRENSLPDIAVLVQIYNEKLHSQLKKMPAEFRTIDSMLDMPATNVELMDALATLDDEILNGRLLENDEKFLALRCLLHASKIEGFQEELNFEDGLIIVKHKGETSLIAIEELYDIPERFEHNQQEILKHLGRDFTTYIPLFIHGNHFTLLVIDPKTRTYRYIDSLKDSKNGSISVRDEQESPLLQNFKELLKTYEYKPCGIKYYRNQYSELLQRAHDQKLINLGSVVSEEELSSFPSHNNECGFHVSATIAQMIKEGINCDLSKNFNPIISIMVMRPAFEKLFSELKKKTTITSPSKETDKKNPSGVVATKESLPASTVSQEYHKPR